MCGIAGIVNARADEPVSRDVIDGMCAAIRHRGPDEGGAWCAAGAGIGIRRLSIIDVAGGHQPVPNEDGTVAIVFNGEIYNHASLRADLEARGHRFRTRADTESVLHAYEEFGEGCVERLRGMFAFAIWDKTRRKLFAARDRLGIKPFHYLDDGRRLLFGSEIKAILAAPGVRREVDAAALVQYMAYSYVPAPRTMFAAIHKLPAGHILAYEEGRVRVEPYWDVPVRRERPRPESHYVDGALEILSEAVRIRLMSEVPLGAFLSGGTDSSVVVGLMARHASEPVKTFSIGFDFERYDERAYARRVAEHFKTEHHEEVVRADARAVVQDLVRQFDEPFADSSAIPTYYVCKIARQRVTVALSGDGGDELFAGYLRYADRRHVAAARRVPAALRSAIFAPLTRLLPGGFPGIDHMRDLIGDADAQYVRHMTQGMANVHGSVFSEALCRRVETTDPSPLAVRYLERVRDMDVLTRRQYLDTKLYLCDDILCKVDRTSMLVSLEARVPILDHELVEFAAGIPAELRMKGATTKYILKKVAERLLPADLVHRPKKGFSVPVAQWLRGEWAPWCDELVLGGRALGRDNFRRDYLERVVREHASGRRDNASILWKLMMLELWYREFMDPRGG